MLVRPGVIKICCCRLILLPRNFVDHKPNPKKNLKKLQGDGNMHLYNQYHHHGTFYSEWFHQ